MQTKTGDVNVDGTLTPCNGYIIVEPTKAKTDIIVIGDLGPKSGVVVKMSGDDTDDVSKDDFDWKPGDVIYYVESLEVDKETLVHWTDVVAMRKFA